MMDGAQRHVERRGGGTDSLDAFKGVADALNGLGLDRYAGRLQAEGWDSIDDLHHLARPSLEAIARGAGMLPGHTFRFVEYFASARPPLPPSTASTPHKTRPTTKPQSTASNVYQRLAASSREGMLRAAAAAGALRTRGSNMSTPAPRPPAPLSACTQRIGGAPSPSDFSFERLPSSGCLSSVRTFIAAANAIGAWPSAWQEQQPGAVRAYNALQALPLPVGDARRGCERVMLRGAALESILSPDIWKGDTCFWFGAVRSSTLSADASTCKRECHTCRVVSSATAASDAPPAARAYFDCDNAQPQAYLQGASPRDGPTRISADRPKGCELPTEMQMGLRPPSLSPLLPLTPSAQQAYSRAAAALQLRPAILPRSSIGGYRGPFAARTSSGNWCANVSGSVGWSLEGRRRYETWPRMSGAPFLSGAALRSHSDAVLFDFESISFPSEPLSQGSSRPLAVYVRAGHAVDRFFRDYRPKLGNRPYVLITGGTDACAPPANLEHKLDTDPGLIAWFARNPSVAHPKLQPLPTGVDTANVSLYARALALAPAVPKERLLYASFTMRADASARDRNEALEAVRRIGAERGAYWHAAPPKLPEIEDMYNMMRSHFVLSPTGNGPDCTRTYRALLLGTIPVVNRKTNPLVLAGLYSGTPTLIVDDWAQLSGPMLERRLAEITHRFRGGWERRWLFAEWWVERVQAALAAGRLPAGACAAE